MEKTEICYCCRSDVAGYLKACNRLLNRTGEAPLSPHERQLVLLYTRKLIEAFL
jgi:hypothetical protein